MAAASDSDDAEAAMSAMMGFSNFTTSGSKGRNSSNTKKDVSTPQPSQHHLTGSNTQPLAKRHKPTPSYPHPSSVMSSRSECPPGTAFDPRPKSTSPPPYIPPSMYPSHILPRPLKSPSAAAMLNMTTPELSPAHSTRSAVSDAGPFHGISAGPPLHTLSSLGPGPHCDDIATSSETSTPQTTTNETGMTPFPAPIRGLASNSNTHLPARPQPTSASTGPPMTTYNAFSASQHPQHQSKTPIYPVNAPGTTSSFISQDVRFAPPTSLSTAQADPNIPNPTSAPSIPNSSHERSYGRDGESYTQTNERGDTVYFKPSFITDDPWLEVREFQKRKKTEGGEGFKGFGAESGKRDVAARRRGARG